MWPDLPESTEVNHRTLQDNLAQDLNPDPNNKEAVNSSIWFLIVRADGIHSNHFVLRGLIMYVIAVIFRMIEFNS